MARAERAPIETIAFEVAGENVPAPLRDPRTGTPAFDQIERIEPRLTRVGDQAPEEIVGADQDAPHDPP